MKIGKGSLEVQPISFELEGEKIHVLLNSTKSDLVQNCYAVKIGSQVVIRSGRIDTQLRLDCLKALAEKLGT